MRATTAILATFFICLAGAIGFAPAALADQSSASNTIAVPTIAQDPPLDGDLSNPAWQQAVKVNLAYDLYRHEPARQETAAYIMTDGKYLYVGIVAKQANPIVANQRTNDVGLDTDDEVQIDLWPGGNQGFSYYFISTPLGTHYQISSENTSYEPTWWSSGKISGAGYIVTMKIPLNVMRGATRAPWRVQFARLVQGTRENLVWLGSAVDSDHNDVTFSGYLTGIDPRWARPKARIEVYGLGAKAGRSAGGDTARVGADLSFPITSSTTLVGTLHPDYSNVELDQQTISPTAFQRFFNEVRPFFTQGSGLYNPFDCAGCPGILELNTPNIPTPSQGYAIEGKQGDFNFAAFDAIGRARDDNSESLYYRTPDRNELLAIQRVATVMPDFIDVTTTTGFVWRNHKNAFAYFNYGSDQGTNVVSGNDAQRYDFGSGLLLPNDSLIFSLRKLGDYYNPVDGIIQHPGIAGYDVNGNHQWVYPAKSWLKSVNVYGNLDRYEGRNVGLNQTDNSLGIDLLTRNLIDVNLNTGSDYLRLSNGIFSPITQNSETLTWHSGTATPTVLSFASGRFGPGQVDSWTRSSTMRLGARVSVTLEADDTLQFADSGTRYAQWLERFGFAYQSGPTESIALGVRRIIGTAPLLDLAQTPQNAWNVSFAYHKRLPHDDLYMIYGDPSQLSTVPQLLVKLVHYFGAGKGT